MNAALYRSSSVWDYDDEMENDEEAKTSTQMRNFSTFDRSVELTPIAECRDKSTSAWLHFPHVELIFLLFAFEGAVASQASAIRHVGLRCPSVFFTASATLVRCRLWHPSKVCRSNRNGDGLGLTVDSATCRVFKYHEQYMLYSTHAERPMRT